MRAAVKRKFQPTRPLRGATGGEASDYDKFQISTHAPLAGRDAESERLSYEIADFNPRAPCGARRRDWVQVPRRHRDFNPRAPCGARLRWMTFSQTSMLFQPTRPLRGATRAGQRLARRVGISTHAPLAGRDICTETNSFPSAIISTHAPLAGRDRKSHSTSYVPPVFQPTRPLRGATDWSYLVICLYSDFNPRAPCGARRAGGQHRHQGLQISTHAPLAGRDRERSGLSDQ